MEIANDEIWEKIDEDGKTKDTLGFKEKTQDLNLDHVHGENISGFRHQTILKWMTESIPRF